MPAPINSGSPYLEVPVSRDALELSQLSSVGSAADLSAMSGAGSINLDDASDEERVVELIEAEFEDLIAEETYPCLIKAFVSFDKRVMMPVFKRPHIN